MSYQFYKIMHLAGIMMLFMGLGGVFLHAMNNGTKDTNTARGPVAAFHGLGLLFILTGGFGMLARLDIGFPAWLHPKLLIWVIMGGLLTVGYRMPQFAKAAWIITPILGLAAAYLAIMKPF